MLKSKSKIANINIFNINQKRFKDSSIKKKKL